MAGVALGAARRPAPRPAGHGRSPQARRGVDVRPVARPWDGAARAPRYGHRDQQRLDRPPRRGERAAVPADGRRGGWHRSRAASPRPAACRPAQGRAPRQPDGDDAGVRRRGSPAGGGRVGWGGQHVRPSGQADPRPASGERRPPLPDRPGRLGLRGAERGRAPRERDWRASRRAGDRGSRSAPDARHHSRRRVHLRHPDPGRLAARHARAPDDRPRVGIGSRIGRLGGPHRLRSFA